ncbi:MAG: OmpH family outer membrane protein [Bacteroidota bacterium]
MHRKISLIMLAMLPMAFSTHAKPSSKQPPLPMACLDSEYLMKHMPEYAKVQTNLQVYEEQLKKQIEAEQRTLEVKQHALEKKMQAYQKVREAAKQEGKKEKKKANDATLKKLEAELQVLYQELQRLSVKLRELNMTSQEKTYLKAQELYKPLELKIADAARAVAERLGYGAVQPKQFFIYVHKSLDITKATAKELGIKEEKAPAPKSGKNKKQKK